MGIVEFLKEVNRKKHLVPDQLADDIGVSRATMRRWLKGKDTPSTASCRRLAKYSGISNRQVLTVAGHIDAIEDNMVHFLPEFRDYVKHDYPDELIEDIIKMAEDLIKFRGDLKLFIS